MIKFTEINLDDLYEMVDCKYFGNNLSKDDAHEIFKKLDKDSKGIIKSEDLIELLKREQKDDWLAEFYKSVDNYKVTSMSEVIIQKLKDIKENKNLNLDSNTLDDLDW